MRAAGAAIQALILVLLLYYVLETVWLAPIALAVTFWLFRKIWKKKALP